MPVIMHSLIIMYLIYHFFHLFVERYLVIGLGLPWPVASIVAFVIVGIVAGLVFGHRHSFL